MSKNPSYKNINNSSTKSVNELSDFKYLISYNNNPHLIIGDEDDLNEYMEDYIQHIYNNIYLNDFLQNTYYNQPKIIKTKYGYEIIEHNPFSITNYDNIVARLTYQKVNSI